MLTTTIDLSLTPGGVRRMIHVSQYDVKARTLNFVLYDADGVVSLPSGVHAAIRGTKPDKNGFDYTATISGSTVTVEITEQMTAVAGNVMCELYLWVGTPPTSTTPASSNYEQLGTANFILQVERAALDKDTLPSDSEIRQIIEIDDNFDEIIDAAEAIQTALATAVRYDETQDLDSTEQATARTNISAASAADVTALGTRMTAAESDIDALEGSAIREGDYYSDTASPAYTDMNDLPIDRLVSLSPAVFNSLAHKPSFTADAGVIFVETIKMRVSSTAKNCTLQRVTYNEGAKLAVRTYFGNSWRGWVYYPSTSVTDALDAAIATKASAADVTALEETLADVTEIETITIDKSTCTKLAAYMGSNGAIGTQDNCSLIYFACQPGTTYTVQKTLSARFRLGTTTVVPANQVTASSVVENNTGTVITYTPATNAQYLVIYYYDGANDTLSESEIYNSLEITYEGTEITAIDTVARDQASGKVDIEQGAENVGKALVVGDDGAVTLGDAGVPAAVQSALLNLLQHVAYTDEHGQAYYKMLVDAFTGGSLRATLNLGTHEVYPTDALESLRNYLTVVRVSDGQPIVDYELSGSLNTIGTAPITVTSGDDSTVIGVPVVSNESGLLYEWDFTKSLTDLRQVQTATLHTGEAWEIPGKSEGTTPPVQGSTGIVFNDAQQLARILPSDMETTQMLRDKTIQVDVASFQLAVSISSVSQIRFLCTLWDNQTAKVSETGLFYIRESNTRGWAVNHVARDSSEAWTTHGAIVSGQPDDISGHTVSVYINNDLQCSMYIDGVLKGAFTETLLLSGDSMYGLQIGAGSRPAYGGVFYNARITGLRIYDGSVVQ